MLHRNFAPPSLSPRGRPRTLRPSLAAAVVLAGVAAACVPPAQPGLMTPPAAALPADTTVFPQPVTVSSVNGVLDVVMNVEMHTLPVGTRPQTLRAWRLVSANGVSYEDSANAVGFPGPTFRVKRGDRVRILLNNRLPEGNSNEACADYPAVASGVDHFQDCFHGYNWTNIHYHGFHVTPDSIGDDVLLMIAPDSSYQYSFVIPHNQSPGTHWYHPHKHGSVAVQVSNGMSGAFIVEGGPLDSLTNSLRMTERLIAIQKVDSALNLTDGDGGVTLINGDSVPTITMRPGEVQRWRIVNENITKTSNYEISFQDEDGAEPLLYDVARDGVQYAPANYSVARNDPTLLMAPGNRLDVFVQAPADTGTAALQVRSVVNRGARQPRFQVQAAAAPAPLFYVRVVDDGTPVNTTLPATLPPLPGYLANLPGTADTLQILADTARLAVIVFADTGFVPSRSPTAPPAFFLGTNNNPHMQFNSDSMYTPESAAGTPLPMILDSVQTWMVVNRSAATNHPFHIHINPFQVIDVSYPLGAGDPNAALYAQLDSAAQSRGAPIWLDVLPLPLPSADGSTPGFALIRQAYQPLLNVDGSVCEECGPAYGEFVMHCHILGHEERGMMQVIQIIPGASMAAAAINTVHAAHAPAEAQRSGGVGNGRTGGTNQSGGGHQH